MSRGRPYAERKFQLQFDSLWLSMLGLAATWALTSFEASVSYGLGAVLGLGYVTLLARSVEAIGGTGGPGAWPLAVLIVGSLFVWSIVVYTMHAYMSGWHA